MCKTAIALLCGGFGKRLWPLSRSNSPKQFALNLIDDDISLFQKTINRLRIALPSAKIIICCNKKHVFLALQQLSDIQFQASVVIAEPASKNTLPSAIMACLQAKKIGADRIIFSPSDHYIANEESFIGDFNKLNVAISDNFITLMGKNITNNSCELIGKKFGIMQAESLDVEPKKVIQFIEKPNSIIDWDSGYINCGYLGGRVETILHETNLIVPEIFKLTKEAMEKATTEYGNLVPKEEIFTLIESTSIDHGLLQHSKKINMIECLHEWSDCGSWENIAELQRPNFNNNYLSGATHAINSNDNFIKNHNQHATIFAYGLEKLFIYAHNDITFITPKDKISEAIEAIFANKNIDFESNKQVLEYKKWGHYVVLAEFGRYKIKKLVIRPNSQTSLQLHHHRTEYWLTSSGCGEVIIGKEHKKMNRNDSFVVEQNTQHLLYNNNPKENLEIIEIQFGLINSEEDIVRLQS